MDRRYASIAGASALLALAASLAACSGPSASGASSSLVTGSVFSSAPKAPVNPDNPASRHTKVAMVSASAVKCGFYFDPAKLRQSTIDAQAAGGDLAKVQQDYDAVVPDPDNRPAPRIEDVGDLRR